MPPNRALAFRCGGLLPRQKTVGGTVPAAIEMAAPAAPAAAAVAGLLRDRATRDATLTALERHEGGGAIDRAVSLAAAPALTDLIALPAAEVPHEVFQRVGLLRGRLLDVAPVRDRAALFGEMFGGGRMEAEMNSPGNVIAAAIAKGAAALTREDAMSWACMLAFWPPSSAADLSLYVAAAGFTGVEQWMGLFAAADPLQSKKKQPTDEVHLGLLPLVLELLRSTESMPKLAVGAAWFVCNLLAIGRTAVGREAAKSGIFDLAVAHLRTMEPADRLCISKGGGLTNYALLALSSAMTSLSGEQERPDQEALVASGVIDVCVDVCSAFAARGIEGLPDTHPGAAYMPLSMLSKATKLPGCEVKIRGVAKALGFCLEHSLEYISEMGMSSGSAATRICVGVFGRDEGGSEFTFTQQHIDALVFYMTDTMRGKTAAFLKPDSTKMVALDLCTSPKAF